MKKSTKKLALMSVALIAMVMLSGCSAPTDEAGNIIYITSSSTLSQTLNDSGWFGIFVYPLAQIINYVTENTGNVALGIVAATVLGNIIVFVLTLKSQIQTQQMQAMQPELTKIQQKYAGKEDKASQMKQAQEMQALYSKYNVNPLTSMLGLFLQFPLIIAIYQAVQRSEAVAHGTLLGLSLEYTPLEGIQNGQFLYIVLFVVMLVCQLGSMLLPRFMAEQKAKKKAEEEHRKYRKEKDPNQNMMYYMMLPILILSIMWPSGMLVYWIISSLVNIIKTLVLQFIIEKRK